MAATGVHAPASRVKSGPSAFFASVLRSLVALPPAKALGALYLFFTLLRVLLAYAATKTPVIMPDSALYLHLSRSIFEKGALLFRGQPIRYEYILYPLLLSPLHLLPQGVSLFRAVQVYNALLMHLAVFPAYALARAITKSHAKGLLVALFTLIMPDLLIVEHIMAESVAFPLILTACYAFYKMYDSPPRLGTCVLWGALSFLLYALKPGYAALPACFFALLLWDALRGRSMARLYQAMAGILSMLSFIGLYTLLLRYGLHLSSAQSTLYGSQTHPLTWEHLLQTFNGMLVYAGFVPLAFGFFPLYLPAAHLGSFAGREKRLLQTVLLALLFIVLGTVYVIYYDELGGGNPYTARVHVRYVAAFLPVLISYMLSPALSGKRMNTSLFALMAFSLICLIRWDGQALLSGKSYPVDAMLLTAATVKTQSFNGGLLWPMAAGVFLLVMGYRLIRRGFENWERRAVCVFLAFAFLLSGTLAFALNRHHNDTTLPGDAREAVAAAKSARSLGVVRDGACFWPEAAELDIASRCTLPVVELDDILGGTAANGSLGAFTPPAYWAENAVNAIEAPTKLILAKDVLSSILLTDKVRATARAASQKGYAVVDIVPGEPWVHSGLSGLNENWVQPGSRFTLFDEGVRARGRITLQLQARAGQGQARLTLRCASQTQTFTLSDSLTWIGATFAVENPAQAVSVSLENSGGNVLVQTYLVE